MENSRKTDKAIAGAKTHPDLFRQRDLSNTDGSKTYKGTGAEAVEYTECI